MDFAPAALSLFSERNRQLGETEMKASSVLGAMMLCLGLGTQASANSLPGRECGYRPSFNCAKADDQFSRQICVNPELLTADCALGYAYRDAREKAGVAGSEAVVKSQRAWISTRDAACRKSSAAGLAFCLRNETVRRVRWLINRYHLAPQGKVYENLATSKPSAPQR